MNLTAHGCTKMCNLSVFRLHKGLYEEFSFEGSSKNPYRYAFANVLPTIPDQLRLQAKNHTYVNGQVATGDSLVPTN